MSPTLIQVSAFALALFAGAVYYQLLAKNSKSNKLFFRTILIMSISVGVTYFLADLYVSSLYMEARMNVFSAVVVSMLHTLELFVFQTHILDNGYYGYIFGSDVDTDPGHPWMLYVFIVTFVLASITSIALVIRAFNRRRAGREWLSTNKGKAAHTHVFFLGGEACEILAGNIKQTHPDDTCVFVGYPDPEENYMGLSMWEKIKRLFMSRSDEERGPFDAVVYSRIPITEASGNDICRQLNLKDLDAYLRDQGCNVYLLSDDEDDNLSSAESLYRSGCLATIYFRACKEGVNRMYEDAMAKTPSINIHLVDASYLAVRNVLGRPDLLPVHYVDKGLDVNGNPEGWVSSPFDSMILGFGETGRAALGFLYEQGSFVARDFGKNPFSCIVMDNDMDTIEQHYKKDFPGMNETAGITFRQCEIGGNKFWEEMEGRIQGVNYIVVCLGNDRVNLGVAVDIVEFAYRHGRDLSKNFVILILQRDPTRLDELTLRHYNSIPQYHNCIRTFGYKKDVWTYDNITNESLTSRARNYFAGYERAQGKEVDAYQLWNAREDAIVNTTDFGRHSKLVRQRSQDYANCFHISTKLSLIGPEIYDHRREIARCIPADYYSTPTHYTGTDPHVETVLHYLAVQEHIRWETSHVAMGYTPGEKTDEIKKTHHCILSYDELSPDIQHYDYLVVKTTFELDV